MTAESTQGTTSRYDRQIRVKEIGTAGHAKIAASVAVVAGLGALCLTLKGLIEPGDRVVTGPFEHNSAQKRIERVVTPVTRWRIPVTVRTRRSIAIGGKARHARLGTDSGHRRGRARQLIRRFEGDVRNA